jgi:hypothetical protein
MRASRWLVAVVVFVWGADGLRAELKIENIQAAYARFGPVRQTLTVTSQDEIFFYFDVVGVQPDGASMINLVVRVEVADPSGKKVLANDNPTRGKLPLGGDRLAGVASVLFGATSAAGAYTLKVTTIDKLSGDKAAFQRTLTYQPGGFHIVSPQFFYDAERKIPAPLGGVAGQTLYVRLNVVGLDPGAVKLDTAMSLQVLDSQGKEMMRQPVVAVIREGSRAKIRQVQFVTFTASLTLTRAGDFTLRIVVDDRAGKQTARFEAPLVVTGLPLNKD